MASSTQGLPHGTAHRPAGSGDSVGSDSQSDSAVTLSAPGVTAATPAAGQSEPETGNPRTQERIQKLIAERDAALALVAQLKETTPMTTTDEDQINNQTPASPPPSTDPRIAEIIARDEVMDSLPALTRQQAAEVVKVVQRLGNGITHEEAAILAARAKPELFPSATPASAARANAQAFTPQAPSSGPRVTAAQEMEQRVSALRQTLTTARPGTDPWFHAQVELQRLDFEKRGSTLR